MSTHILANKKTTVHKKSSGKTASYPDACKTPTPGGPQPIPYPNLAMSSSATKTTKKVRLQSKGACVHTSKFSTSSGDEAGTAGGGVISSKIKGTAGFKNYSMDVKFEKKKAARQGDPMATNGGSNPNSASIEAQMGVPNPGDDERIKACKAPTEPYDPDAPEGPDGRKATGCKVDTNDREQYERVCREHGMSPDHCDAIRDACQETGKSVSFRKGNPDSLAKIEQGYPCKPLEVKAKTINDDRIANLDPADKQKIDQLGMKGFVGHYEKVDGHEKLVGVQTTSGTKPLTEIHSADDIPANTYTGDYDPHDMFDSSGKRMGEFAGGGEAQELRKSINDNIGPRRGRDGRYTGNTVQHGPQADYDNYCKHQESLPPGKRDPSYKGAVPGVMAPDTPVLHFDEDGNVYQIKDEQDLANLYKCKGADPPDNWKKSGSDFDAMKSEKDAFGEPKLNQKAASGEGFAKFKAGRSANAPLWGGG